MAIVTAGEFDTYIQDELGATEATLRATSLAAAHRAVYTHCQRSFEAAGASTARTYVPTGTDVLRIADCNAVSSVTVDGTTVTSTRYQLEPTAIDLTGLTRAFEQIRLLDDIWRPTTYAAKASISVTAAWGWTATPSEAIEAVKVHGKTLVMARRMNVGMIDTTKELLADLRRQEAFGFG